MMMYSNKLRGFFNINQIEFYLIGFYIFKVDAAYLTTNDYKVDILKEIGLSLYF